MTRATPPQQHQTLQASRLGRQRCAAKGSDSKARWVRMPQSEELDLLLMHWKPLLMARGSERFYEGWIEPHSAAGVDLGR